ncbi:MAG: hypothetical protein Q4C91_20095 [Eubacteriales bacterium]|nr:hypothetical protein [Eubacteriales bacterium]
MKGKRIFRKTAALCVLLALLLPAAVSAQETESPGADSLVLETVVTGTAGMVNGGKAEAELPDGNTITTESEELQDGLLLVVELAEEQDGSVFSWIQELLKGKATKLRAYDIYFVDSSGMRYEIKESLRITISLNGGYSRPVIYYVDKEEGAGLLKSSVSGDRISFETGTFQSSYYVLGERTQDTGPGPMPDPSPDPSPTAAPTVVPTVTPTAAPTPIPVPDNYPDGSVVQPDGSIRTPDGTVIAPDGTITLPDGTKLPPDENGKKPSIDKDGTVTEPDGTVYHTDGSIQASDGAYLRPATPWLEMAEVYGTGNQVRAVLSGPAAGVQGYDYVISKNINCIKDKDYLSVSKNILLTETNFRYIQKGTYYVYCHAWVRGKDGKKVFSKWSNYKEVTVTAVTPSTPKITRVKVKGNNVTVTYTQSKDAAGYDLVLGSAARKVYGELRPVSYGARVKKVKNGNTVTVTFRNVKAGTYYAGLHAWNRTSEDGKKVFSPWSNVKKVTVK